MMLVNDEILLYFNVLKFSIKNIFALKIHGLHCTNICETTLKAAVDLLNHLSLVAITFHVYEF